MKFLLRYLVGVGGGILFAALASLLIAEAEIETAQYNQLLKDARLIQSFVEQNAFQDVSSVQLDHGSVAVVPASERQILQEKLRTQDQNEDIQFLGKGDAKSLLYTKLIASSAHTTEPTIVEIRLDTEPNWISRYLRFTKSLSAFIVLLALGGILFSLYLARRVNREQREVVRQTASLRHQAATDPLTELPNRRTLDEFLEKLWTDQTVAGPVSAIMLDIDSFKAYNDNYGHIQGDKCLQTLAKAIQEPIADLKDAVVARYGGEEFAVVLPGLNTDQCYVLADAIRQNVQSKRVPHADSNHGRVVTISAGCATANSVEDFAAVHLMQNADTALYEAKGAGRNTVRRFKN